MSNIYFYICKRKFTRANNFKILESIVTVMLQRFVRMKCI